MHKSSNSTHDKHSEAYITEAREYWWNEDYLALLASRLELQDCQAMTDVGCGEGSISLRLAHYLPPAAQVTGIDTEKHYLKRARQKAKHDKGLKQLSFSFVEGDANDLPLEDDSQDLTLCQTVLIHMQDPAHVLGEMIRVTKPGGWVVAMEPNNLVSNLMLDRYKETDLNIPAMLETLEVRLRMEQGKKALGEGYSSLGDVLPDLFQQAGLEDMQVWMSDKAMPLIPPYDNREKRVRAAQLIEWLENGSGGFNYNENLRYFKAGGGKKSDFDVYWNGVERAKIHMLHELKNQKFFSSGGNVMYIVAARVPEE